MGEIIPFPEGIKSTKRIPVQNDQGFPGKKGRTISMVDWRANRSLRDLSEEAMDLLKKQQERHGPENKTP